jgi:hypothetical protein
MPRQFAACKENTKKTDVFCPQGLGFLLHFLHRLENHAYIRRFVNVSLMRMQISMTTEVPTVEAQAFCYSWGGRGAERRGACGEEVRGALWRKSIDR